jgi:hypothetical protein
LEGKFPLFLGFVDYVNFVYKGIPKQKQNRSKVSVVIFAPKSLPTPLINEKTKKINQKFAHLTPFWVKK